MEEDLIYYVIFTLIICGFAFYYFATMMYTAFFFFIGSLLLFTAMILNLYQVVEACKRERKAIKEKYEYFQSLQTQQN